MITKKIDILLEDIKKLKVIFNDCDCNNTFFEDVCCQLKKDGILFSETNLCKGIDVSDAIVITLDQQYASGTETFILGAYDNERVGDSDALALSIQAAFLENNILVDTIICGKTGYREFDDGRVMDRIPTKTEDSISNKSNTSFATIALGTDNISVDLVVKSIESALARFASYLKKKNIQNDFIYRVDYEDTISNIADRYNLTVEQLNLANSRNSDEELLIKDQIIYSPNVKIIQEFDKEIEFNIR